MKLPASALILAGGQSRRMGTDKALILLDNQPLIAHIARTLRATFHEVLLSTNHPEKYAFLHLPILQDPIPDTGPMAGVIAGLRVARYPRLAVIACDILDPDMELLRELLDCCPPAPAAAPICNGKIQPLFAVYTGEMLSRIEEDFAAGKRALHHVLRNVNARLLETGDGRIRSFNSPDEFNALLAGKETATR